MVAPRAASEASTMNEMSRRRNIGGSGPLLATNDVTEWVHLLAEDAQLRLGGGGGLAGARDGVDLEAGVVSHALHRDAGVQAEHLHAERVGVVAHDGQVGDDPEWPGARREAGGLARPGAGEVAGRGDEVEFGGEAA